MKTFSIILFAAAIPSLIWCGGWILFSNVNIGLTAWDYQNVLGVLVGVALSIVGFVILKPWQKRAAPRCADQPTATGGTPEFVKVADLETIISKRIELMFLEAMRKLESELKDQIIAAGLAPPSNRAAVPKPPEVT